MADLNYQRATLTLLSPTRRAVVKQMRAWAIVLLLFALILGCVLFERIVVERIGHWMLDPLSHGRTMVRHYTRVYHWPRLIWVVPFTMTPLVLGAAYWFLAQLLARRAQRMDALVALILAMLHALGCTLLAFTFFFLESASIQQTRWDVAAILTAVGALLGMAMVPGMLYLSVRLMDLLRQPRFVPAAPRIPGGGAAGEGPDPAAS